MSTWITQREAGEIIGVHKSRVAKLVAAGKPTPRPHLDHRASLNRAEVVGSGWVALSVARESPEGEGA